jgi:hypothetical protein
MGPTNGNRRLFPGSKVARREENHSPLSSPKVKNEWSHTYTPTCLHGVLFNEALRKLYLLVNAKHSKSSLSRLSSFIPFISFFKCIFGDICCEDEYGRVASIAMTVMNLLFFISSSWNTLHHLLCI